MSFDADKTAVACVVFSSEGMSFDVYACNCSSVGILLFERMSLDEYCDKAAMVEKERPSFGDECSVTTLACAKSTACRVSS